MKSNLMGEICKVYKNPSHFGPIIPFQSGQFGLDCFCPISGVGHFGSTGVSCFIGVSFWSEYRVESFHPGLFILGKQVNISSRKYKFSSHHCLWQLWQ